jgi:hypothetical protein
MRWFSVDAEGLKPGSRSAGIAPAAVADELSRLADRSPEELATSGG